MEVMRKLYNETFSQHEEAASHLKKRQSNFKKEKAVYASNTQTKRRRRCIWILTLMTYLK
jgi:hypothetical protein